MGCCRGFEDCLVCVRKWTSDSEQTRLPSSFVVLSGNERGGEVGNEKLVEEEEGRQEGRRGNEKNKSHSREARTH